MNEKYAGKCAENMTEAVVTTTGCWQAGTHESRSFIHKSLLSLAHTGARKQSAAEALHLIRHVTARLMQMNVRVAAISARVV